MLGHTHENELSRTSEFVEWSRFHRVYLAFRVGYGIAMRIETGIAEVMIEPADELRAFHMLKLLCNVVNFVPAEFELLGKKHLPEPVPPYNVKRQLFAFP